MTSCVSATWCDRYQTASCDAAKKTKPKRSNCSKSQRQNHRTKPKRSTVTVQKTSPCFGFAWQYHLMLILNKSSYPEGRRFCRGALGRQTLTLILAIKFIQLFQQPNRSVRDVYHYENWRPGPAWPGLE